jgi:hypothetical protein
MPKVDWYDRRKLAGICTRCGLAPRGETSLECKPCASRRRQLLLQRRAMVPGTCSKCGKLAGLPKKRWVCPECHQVRRRRDGRICAWRAQVIQMTIEEYDRLFASQRGRCAICQTDKPGQGRRNLHVDHDHEFGHVRGLLCVACNRMIGLAGDSPAMLRAAAAYIERHQPTLIRPVKASRTAGG